MKEITVQTFNGEEKVEESKLTIEDHEILVVQTPKEFTVVQSKKVHDLVKRAFRGEFSMITIPYGVEFKTIKVE